MKRNFVDEAGPKRVAIAIAIATAQRHYAH